MIRIRDIDTSDSEYVKYIAKLHMKAFPDFFLTQLGSSFLKTLYMGYLKDTNSGIIVAEDNGRLVGFIAYSYDYSAFFKGLIKHHILRFGISSFIAVLRHPSFTKRVLSALKKSNEVQRKEAYVELASIGVDPEIASQGVGSQMISYLKDKVDFDKYAYINLETDADNNDGANHFYIKNEFVLVRQYITNEGRRMNEYRYSLGS